MNIIIHGASGKMGQMLSQKAQDQGIQVAAEVAFDFAEISGNRYAYLEDYKGKADVVIDFSSHLATRTLLDYCLANQLPVVVSTTGQTEEERQMILDAAKSIPVFFSANMSVGVAVLADLAKRAAAAFPNADIEIVEIHHNQKKDVPSGTALMLAHSIQEVRENSTLLVGRHENGKRTAEEIGIHSIRLGTETGTHEIMISTGSETITLKHEASSRALFADGALKAAEWLIHQPAGLYQMKDMLAGE